MYIKIMLFLFMISLTACVHSPNTPVSQNLQTPQTRSMDGTPGIRGPEDTLGDRTHQSRPVAPERPSANQSLPSLPVTQPPPPPGSARKQISGNRMALVIGNSNYDIPQLRLDNPVNDARAMAATLESLGFKVTRVENANLTMMRDAVDHFKSQLKANYGVGLFYFAGHGVQSASGLNYLIPIDFVPQAGIDLNQHSVDTDDIRKSMEASKNPLNIAILDACRNNPFATTTRSAKGPKRRGLARMQVPRGSLIALATKPGAEALDSGGPNGKNGLYTWYLLQNMRTPGIDIYEMFRNVTRDVYKATGGAQEPWYHSSVQDRFVLVSTGSTIPTPEVDYTIYNQGNTAASRTVGVEFAMFQDDGTPNPRMLKDGDTLRSGDSYFFHIKTTNRPQNYIYLFQIDSSQKVFKLFPNPNTYHTKSNPVPANTTITLPNDHKVWVLDDTIGDEKFYLLVSDTAVPALENFTNGTLGDVINSGLPLRGPAGIKNKTSTVAAKVGDAKVVVQQLNDTDNLTHAFTIKHK